MASGPNPRAGGSLEPGFVRTSDELTVDGRRVTLTDTPGFDDVNPSDTDVLRQSTELLTAAWVL